MKLKSYFAQSVEAAMADATRELGSDAMLVYSREAPPEARSLGTYEVVFAVPAVAVEATEADTDQRGRRPEARTLPFPARAGTADPASAEASSELARQLADMRRQIGKIAGSLVRSRNLAGSGAWRTPGLAEALDDLLDVGLSAELVEELASRVERDSADAEQVSTDTERETEAESRYDDIPRLLRRELGTMFRVDARIGAESGGSRNVAVVGPPGSGKTTTLVKLAARYGLRSRKPVQILSVDTWRVGGAEQLRSYAAILGVGFQSFDTVVSLGQSIAEHKHKNLVLIDTPGYGALEMDAGADLAALFSRNGEIDVHLALPASMKPADLTGTVTRFEPFAPRKLIFTRTDETASAGTLLNEAVRTGKPVSFLTTGQQIPEDLSEAEVERLLDLVLNAVSSPPEPLGTAAARVASNPHAAAA